MTKDPSTPGATEQTPRSPTSKRAPRLTRAGAAWVATAFALLLVMLIIFILQNPTRVEVNYLGFTGSLPLGMALLIAAVAGGVLVAVVGVTRVTQLRMNALRDDATARPPDRADNPEVHRYQLSPAPVQWPAMNGSSELSRMKRGG